jgi:hypothetical protein
MKTLAILTAAVAMLAAAPATATEFDYGSFSVINQQNITFTLPLARTGGAGEIVLNGTGPNAGQQLDAWCIDLFDNLASSSIYNIVPLTNAGVGFPNPTLTNQQISQMGSLMIHGTADVPGDPDINASAAFQLAIWNIEYQGDLLDNASGALATLVAVLVSRVQPGGIWDCPGCTVDQLDVLPQNQVLAFGVPSETPLPSAMLLFATGIGGAAALLRKRRKVKA